MKMRAYIERQKSPTLSRRVDPGFNSVGLNDGRGNLVELQVNATTGRWECVIWSLGKPPVTVAEGVMEVST